MRPGTLNVIKVVILALLVVTACSANAIPAGPVPLPPPSTLAFIPAGPVPLPPPGFIPAGPVPLPPPTTVAFIPAGPVPLPPPVA